MKKLVIEFVKNSKFLYALYYYIMNIFLSILKLVIRPQNNLILFITAGGKRYMDSPRYMYEFMIQDERFSEYEMVWAFRNPAKVSIPGRAKVIKTDTLRYYITALKARCWITNVNVERGLFFKGKNTFYFCTWHGTAIKKIGFDIQNENTFARKGKTQYDVICGQGEHDRKIYHSAFHIEDQRILLCGFPRNDRLFQTNYSEYAAIRKKLGIPNDAKVILYAPTFHDTTQKRSTFAPPVHLERWIEVLGMKYFILFRAHPSVFKLIGVTMNTPNIIDVSNYPEINDLYIASDMLVSDYSSIFFDYSILSKPMFCFAYDYSEYTQTRGVYLNICDELSGGEINEDTLLKLIKNVDVEAEVKKARRFCQKYISASGNATQETIEYIYQHIR